MKKEVFPLLVMTRRPVSLPSDRKNIRKTDIVLITLPSDASLNMLIDSEEM